MTHQMLLNGEWVERERHTTVTNPENGEIVGHVPLAEEADVELAMSGATRALSHPLPGYERSRILADAADLLEGKVEEAATLIASEGIKTIREARSEAQRTVTTLRLSGEEAKRLTGETLSMDQSPSGTSMVGFTVREPLGIVGAITPFNDPLNLVAHKIGPALAAGNAVVLKPDSKTPLSALLLAGCLQSAGLPDGWLQVLTGPGSIIGDAIVTHPAVRMVSFTGGVEVGRAIHARTGLKRVSMELGANNAVIVHRDADLVLAAERIGSGAFWAAGQNCLHVQRVYAHDEVFDEVTNRLAKHAESVLLGPKLSEDTDMGPLIDRHAMRRTTEIVTDAVDTGAEILTGGESFGTSFRPTLLANVAPGSRVLTEEVYAPLTVLSQYSDLDDAIEMANESDYGLAGAVFTKEFTVAFSAARRLEVGQVMINESTDFRIDAMPFGGEGSSGLGREGVAYSVKAMTATKVIAFSDVEVPGLG